MSTNNFAKHYEQLMALLGGVGSAPVQQPQQPIREWMREKLRLIDADRRYAYYAYWDVSYLKSPYEFVYRDPDMEMDIGL